MDIKKMIQDMTLEEKASLCSGSDFWRTKAVERLGLPKLHLSDGPHGLRKQAEGGDHLGVNISIDAVCFPASCGTAASFDPELIESIGETIGEECRAENVAVILGPAMNIKRSPLCGRNFEYMSEDPYLAGEMAAAFVRGVQSRGVGTSVKHFALNNQEHERMSGSSEASERTMREIYLAAFERAVKESAPWTLMCSYNKINGEYASENHWLLTELLREEWGFDGLVVSDWAAVNDRIKGLEAGLDLEMPSSGGDNDRLIVEAVKNKTLSEEVLDRAVERYLKLVEKYIEHDTTEKYVFDKERDHNRAVEFAKESMVLLKNENHLLPLSEKEGILFVGGFAKKPRFQGGGSAHITTSHVSNCLDESKKRAQISYEEGFDTESGDRDEAKLEAAVEAARKASTVVIFAGLPDSFESEGYDREHMRLPEVQNELIRRIAEVQKRTIVVLHNGSPVEMPWINEVDSVLEAYLGGEGVGEAEAALLFGEANPCGKLAESFPIKLSDNPSYLNFPGKNKKVFYNEGIFVGYRYYDRKEMEVLFPFGHGLSYTKFSYSDLTADKAVFEEGGALTVSVRVTNCGDREGKEVVQFYVSDLTGTTLRPVKELKGFQKVKLAPGETKTVSVTLNDRSFAYYDEEVKAWVVPQGRFEILAGGSSRELPVKLEISAEPKNKSVFKANTNTTVGEIMDIPGLYEAIRERLLPKLSALLPKANEDQGQPVSEAISEDMERAILKYMPLRGLRSFGHLTNREVEELVDLVNSEAEKL